MEGPLTGVRILDCSAVISGPLAAMMLAEQGADVIKIEPPGLGDITRAVSFARGGITALFANANRGKRSLVLDVRDPRGRDLLLRLVDSADVLIQNYRPGVMERLGLGAADLQGRAPRLIYVSISGYGADGPYAQRRVYDPIIQGLTGHVAVQRPTGGSVDLVRTIVCDKATAYTTAQAITAALFARERGAGGQHLRIAMLDAGLAFFWPDGMIAHTLVGEGVTPGVALYDLYRLREVADGQLVVFAASDAEFAGLARALECPDLLEDPRFTSLADRIRHIHALEERLGEEFKKWNSAAIVARLIEEQVPAGPIHSIEEVLKDPQVQHNGAIVNAEHPEAGSLRQARPAARFEVTPAELGRHAPSHGEHSDEILAELGVDAAERDALRSAGVTA